MADKPVKAVVKLQLQAGAATPAPPVGTVLGPHGINLPGFVKQFNDATAKDKGLVIPVVVTIYGDRSFDFVLKTPPAAVLIKKATGLHRFNLSYKVAALGRHYDVITPLSTGGQPFQVFYTSKYGIKAGQGVSIAMGKYIFYQIIYFICISIVLFGNMFSNTLVTSMDSVSAGLVTTLSWIGYAICAGLIVVVTFISLNRRAGTSFVVGILKFLSKIKIEL